MSSLLCASCEATFDLDEPIARCRNCGGLLAVRHTQEAGSWTDRLSGPDSPSALHQSGVWRYRALVHPRIADDQIISFPEGNTPILAREAIASWVGLTALTLKHEGMNPTGSFKDRGMTVAVSQARRLGARAVACASTGNTSASMAAYASQAGLTGVVLVPAGKVAVGKLAQTVAYGARILAVRGDFDDCLRLVDEAADRLGLYLANSINPFRLEGQKTIVFELLEQRGFRAPDWIVLPGGNLGNTAAFGKALAETRALGRIDRMPRLAVIQAEGAAPFARGFREGFARRHRVSAETRATAIRIGDPASWDRAVTAIRETNGVVVTVSDPDILEAKQSIDRAGIGCEPASAASVAGVRRLVAGGVIDAGADVVAVLTGHVLKDPEAALAGAPGPIEIEPTLSALDAALR